VELPADASRDQLGFAKQLAMRIIENVGAKFCAASLWFACLSGSHRSTTLNLVKNTYYAMSAF
jgi:hypothetical protein